MTVSKENSKTATALRVKIWGSIGSIPAPLPPAAIEGHVLAVMNGFFEAGFRSRADIGKYLGRLPRHLLAGYGANTACVEVRSDSQQIIIDGGSGIRPLGYEMMSGPCGSGAGAVHILLTHFHWDHLIGLPFFNPVFVPGNKIHFYAVQDELPEIIRTVFKKPFFPVPFEKLGSSIEFHRLEPRKPFLIGDIHVTPYRLDHPDPCWGYRIEKDGRVLAHCVDTECVRFTREQLGPDLGLYQNVDLMLFDAQYTLTETVEKVNWGHAAASLGLDIAMREKIKRVVFMHHDPASTMNRIAAAEAQARRYYENQLKNAERIGLSMHKPDWSFAYDGMLLAI